MKIKNLSPKEKVIIQDILKDHQNVYVFGSRVKGTFKKYSDLDLCFKQHLSDYECSILEEKFEESDLPFTVDIVDYQKVNPSFQQLLDKEIIPLAEFLKQ